MAVEGLELEPGGRFPAPAWQHLMLVGGILIAFDPLRLFERPLLQQVPVALVIGYLAITFLSRPLAPFLSTITTIFVLMLLWALPGITYNKITQDTGMYTAIIMFLIPISAAYAAANADTVDARKLLMHAQWIGIAYLIGSFIRLAADVRQELLWYGIHERSFLLGFVFLPAFLARSRARFLLLFSASCALLLVDFRATTAFSIANGMVVAAFYRYGLSMLFFYTYVGAIMLLLLSIYVGDAVVWDLYALVKGSYSENINDEMRRAAIMLAVDEWTRAPLFGTFFSGAGAYDIRPYLAWWEGGLLPLHNDFLDFLVQGGGVGLAMLLLGLGSALVITLRNMKMQRWGRHGDLGAWNAFLLSTLVNIIFVISFNPVLKTVSHAFVAQLVLAWIVQLEVASRNRLRHEQEAVADANKRLADRLNLWQRP